MQNNQPAKQHLKSAHFGRSNYSSKKHSSNDCSNQIGDTEYDANWERDEFIQFSIGGLQKANQAKQPATSSEEPVPNHAFLPEQWEVLNQAIEEGRELDVAIIQRQENRDKKFSGYAVVVLDPVIRNVIPEGITPFVPGSRLSNNQPRTTGSQFRARIIEVQQRTDTRRAKIILAETVVCTEAMACAEASPCTEASPCAEAAPRSGSMPDTPECAST
jgi:hypothetical protein